MRRPRPASWPLLVALACLALGACEDAKPAPPPEMPALGDLNAHVLAIVDTYPTDGTHGYYWPRSGSWLGFTRTMRYDGRVLGKGDPQARCHCCGLTFEVFLRAWERWCKEVGRPHRILDLDIDGVRRLRRQWFGVGGDRATLHTAITEGGLGVRITDLEKARPGDFVQLWRHSGSGHSCVFRGWERTGKRITGIRYWSTQSSTKGIGERTERFGKDGSTVKRDELWICRIGKRPSRATTTSKP